MFLAGRGSSEVHSSNVILEVPEKGHSNALSLRDGEIMSRNVVSPNVVATISRDLTHSQNSSDIVPQNPDRKKKDDRAFFSR
ncbi:MAG: hypothetical protein Fur0025_28950 [Oscillatoriaceae cyanobacterium]